MHSVKLVSTLSQVSGVGRKRNEKLHRILNLFPTDNFSLTKIICHINFGNEFAFTHNKDYLYHLARSPLSQIFDNETSPQN